MPYLLFLFLFPFPFPFPFPNGLTKQISKMKLPFFLLLFFLASFPPTEELSDLIDQTCRFTPFYDLCVRSLRSDPQSHSADVQGLARIAADAVLANANQTLAQIQRLLDGSPDPEEEQPLAYCAELYIPVVKYTLPQAIDALDKGRYGFAVYGLSDVGKEADACEKKFSGGAQSPITDSNKLVQNLVDVALGIISILRRSY